MADSNRGIYFICPSNSITGPSSGTFSTERQSNHTGQTTEKQSFSFDTSSIRQSQAFSFSTTRCAEKGCVFPATSPESGKCTYHTRQQQEPVLFRSHQPTGLFLDPARMTPADKEYDVDRKRDRRRMAELWEQFQTDGTA